ncbi:MAG: hypothetical protein R2754_00665 [Microthrixaceae bacterium]
MSRRAYGTVVAVAAALTIAVVTLAVLRAADDVAGADRWGTERLIDAPDTPMVRDGQLSAAANNAEVRRRRLNALPAVGAEPVDGGFRLGWEEPADCRARRVVVNETPDEVLVEVESVAAFANDQGTGCAQLGPRGDEVASTLPVHVATVVLDEPLGDRPVRDAARARRVERVVR